MSDPILPLAVWEEGTLQNDVPANDNALRNEAMDRLVLGVEDSPTSTNDGDVFIVGGSPSGDFSTFSPDDLTIYRGGNWYAWAPTEGLVVNLMGALNQYTGSGGWDAVGGGGGASWGGITGTLSSQTDLQSALDAKAQDRRTVSALATSGSVGIDVALGDYFTLALAGNVSGFTFSNLPGSGKGATLMLRITQDSTPRTVAWPASFKWAGGVAGVVSTGSGAVDLLAITTFDNGTTWDATLAKAFA
jgi:hypothetical protein